MEEAPKKPKMLSDLIAEQANTAPQTPVEVHEQVQAMIDKKLEELRLEQEAEKTPVIRKEGHVYKELGTDRGKFVFDLYMEKGQPFCEFFRRGQENVWKYKFWLSCRMLMSELLYNNTNESAPPQVFTSIRVAIKQILTDCETRLMQQLAAGMQDAQDLKDAEEMERKIASGEEKTVEFSNDLENPG